MKILVVDIFGESVLDWILRCQADGHDVRWFMPVNDKTKPIGKGLVEKVDDFRPWMRWADIVFMTDNVRYLRDMDGWRKQGVKIIGPSQEGAAWELDRRLGMSILEKHGIEVPPYREFSDYDQAIAFVKKEDRAFVSKPCGEETDKSLSYVAKSPADLVYMLERWKKVGKLKGSFILQEKVAGCEMGIGRWFGPGGYNEGDEENFEHKKLFPGDMGPNCFTPDAEVLTRDGWKAWPGVTISDEICTLKNGAIIYDKPERLVCEDFDGHLIGWKSPMTDILVTPGHNMYVQDGHYRKPFWLEPATITATQRRTILRGSGEWEGIESEIPECARGNAVAWAALLGAYISDGSCRERSIVFGNCPPHKQTVFAEYAARAGYRAAMYGPDLYINGTNLANYMRGLGDAAEKSVPRYIKDAPPCVIRSFLEGYGAGDGSRRDNNLTYTTVSRQLADDLQELALKIGWCANIQARDRRGEAHEVKGYECVNRLVSYDVGISKMRLKAKLSPDICCQEQYRGKVYCVTVPSHVIYVRRNGKACWIGQTGEMGTVMRYVRRSKLGRMLLDPLEDALARIGYLGCIDVNCIIDENGKPWPLEFTMRPGWPAFNIQQALTKGDHAEWLLDLAEGRDAKPWVYDTIAVGVVMALPDFPYSHATQKEVVGVPIYGLKPSILDSIHPCQVMLGEAPQMKNGTVERRSSWVTAGDYVLVATGTGGTVQAAREKAYRVLGNLKATPSSPFWRTDIGAGLKKQLVACQKHGFAAGMEYADAT